MGKKRAQKDRGYITAKEHAEEWGGFKDRTRGAPFARLPFKCCAITFTPWEDPVCTDDGIMYDIVNVVPYVRKFGRHPVKGTPLQLADLIHLNVHKNADGEFSCPVTGKVFTDHTHIVAVRQTGNVYAWEAVEELNIKAKTWKDLISEEPFTRKDIIHLQDPLNLQARLIEQFDHVRKDLSADEPEEPTTGLRNLTDDMKRALGALGTAEAAEAVARGGGGKRAEARRLLADARLKGGGGGGGAAKAAAGGGAAAKADAPAGGGAAAAAADGAAAGGDGGGGGDWRLRGPAANRDMPAFKPGAVTWDTEDHTAAAAAAAKQQQQQFKGRKKPAAAAAGAAAGGAAAAKADANAGKQSPKEWYEAQGYVKYVTSHLTTGAMSRAFTSTVAASATKNERQLVRKDLTPDKKGYVRLHTSLGDLNLELHCDLAPRTCENFLGLCEMGYYDGVPFHRSIKNFMIQGGDPTGTGMGGESLYGPSFKDELDSRLLHSGRGVLSMANSGPNSNGSQFFILYKSAAHLNYKHSVFGRVVGGMDVISLMEKVPTDSDDRPLQDISITGVTIFTNPFKEMREEEAKKEEEEAKKAAGGPGADDPDAQRSAWYSNPAASHATAAVRSGVGKYVQDAKLDSKPGVGGRALAAAAAGGGGGEGGGGGGGGGAAAAPAAKKQKTQGFGNFDAW